MRPEGSYVKRQWPVKNVTEYLRLLLRWLVLDIENRRRALCLILRAIPEVNGSGRDVLPEDCPHEDLVGRFGLVLNHCRSRSSSAKGCGYNYDVH